VEQAVAAGARYVVSPGFSAAVDRECRQLGVLLVPGVATATELQAALEAGRDVVKFFPAAAAGGAAMVAALSAPFPSARFVPTGGIGAAELGDYLRLTSVLAVGGTWLAPRDAVDSGDFERIARDVREATTLVEHLR
jgi:2-dehydro-3-deoxyphosphogluconate aldolase/(4S)-4-hydroxy-2-oxoglutarate aldolase